jgi:hypothetical protein
MPSRIDPTNGGLVTENPNTAVSIIPGNAYIANLSVTDVKVSTAAVAATC